MCCFNQTFSISLTNLEMKWGILAVVALVIAMGNQVYKETTKSSYDARNTLKSIDQMAHDFVLQVGKHTLLHERNSYHTEKIEKMLYCARKKIPAEHFDENNLEHRTLGHHCGHWRKNVPTSTNTLNLGWDINFHIAHMDFYKEKTTINETTVVVPHKLTSEESVALKTALQEAVDRLEKKACDSFVRTEQKPQ